MKIGILSFSFNNWIAGPLYNQAVIRAISQLPENIRPEIHLIMPRHDDHRHIYEDFKDEIESIIFYDHQFHNKSADSLAKRIPRLLKLKRRSTTLLQCAQTEGIDVIFPVFTSLGADAPVNWIGWIPDFQHRHLPEFFSEQDRAKRDEKYQTLIREASHVVVSSADAKSDLLNFYTSESNRISAYRFRTFADPAWFSENPIQLADDLGLPEKFLMFPSQFWKHKNHELLFESIAQFKSAGNEDICLVLTGKDIDYRNPQHADYLKQLIVKLGLEKNVRHLGLLPRNQQIQMMRRACAIVQPSLFEGWSMLVEDCRALGKTVLLSDLPVHREQAYPSAHYFSPAHPENLTKLLTELWPMLNPGPDLEAEAVARSENRELIKQNGQFLLELFKKVSGSE
jgi:glycosyltransferase involved in cell wall biosynthesis